MIRQNDAMPERTIAGSATSVTAFVGATKSGPISDPVHCSGYGEYDQCFGGLDNASEASYAVRQFFANGGRDAIVVRVEAESPESVSTGIHALDRVDVVNVVCLPGVSTPGILGDTMTYCRSRRAFLIVDAARAAATPSEMAAFMESGDLPRSDCAALYYPWIQVPDPLNAGMLRLTAPSGAIGGLFARTDTTGGVWKAPAGTDARLVDVQGTGYTLSETENGTLNSLGVNCIRVLPNDGTLVWGARTLEGHDGGSSEWKYIPTRRLAFYIEESLSRGLQWAAFERNGEPLWQEIRRSVNAFMEKLFLQGAFQGATQREAYFLKCDRATTTQNDIANGIVNIMVGFAPLKPAEFIIITLRQIAGYVV
jgi:phage tail sheath protein FI